MPNKLLVKVFDGELIPLDFKTERINNEANDNVPIREREDSTMTMLLIKEGNRYRLEPELDPGEMPDILTAEVVNNSELPTYSIGGADINPELGPLLMKMIAEEEEIERQKASFPVLEETAQH